MGINFRQIWRIQGWLYIFFNILLTLLKEGGHLIYGMPIITVVSFVFIIAYTLTENTGAFLPGL
jgi:hypothetical protein